jgi:hypothetical protein
MSYLRALGSFLAVVGLFSVLVYGGHWVMRRARREARWKREMEADLEARTTALLKAWKKDNQGRGAP